METIYLFGAGGVGREIAELAERSGRYDKIFFIDDVVESRYINGFEVYRSREVLSKDFCYDIAVTVGEPRSRKKLCEYLKTFNITPCTFIADDAKLSGRCMIGAGSVIASGVVINTDAAVGKACYINKKAVIPHDVHIGDYCVVGVNAAIGGNSSIGSCTYIGNGATVREKIHIGNNCIIGMGSVVVKNVEDKNVIVGNPGRLLRKNTDGKVFR